MYEYMFRICINICCVDRVFLATCRSILQISPRLNTHVSVDTGIGYT